MNEQHQKSILIVGGTPDSDEAKALASAGYSVDVVATMSQAVETLGSKAYLQVIIDPDKLTVLGESEEMYRNLVERSNDGVVVIQDRLIKFVNRRFEEMSGYSAQTLLNTPFTDYLTPDEIAVLLERYRRRMAGEYVPPVYETALTRRGGRKIPLEISAAIVPFHRRPADLVVVRDATERKQAEEYLQRYRLLSENALDMFLFVGLDGRIIEANSAAAQAYGYSREELLTMSINDLRVGGDYDTIRSLLEQTRHQSVRFETLHRRRDGSTFPVEVSVSGTTIQDEPVLLAIMRDITGRRRAEAGLDSERRRLRAVLDALPVAVFIADAKGKIIESNQQADVIWGGPIPRVNSIDDYAVFKGWWLDSGEPVTPESWAMTRALTEGETVLGDMVQIERFDGTRATIINSAAPIRDAQGRLVGGIVTEQDVTELISLREALERSLEETKREIERTSVLESIAEAGLASLDLKDLLNTVAERVANALGVDSTTVFVFDEESRVFEAYATYGAPNTLGCRIRVTDGLAGKIARHRSPVYIEDVQNDPLLLRTCIRRSGAKVLLAVPLITRGHIVGMTYVLSRTPRRFAYEEVRLLQAISDRVAMAIDNAKLYDALQRSRSDVEETLEQERRFSTLLQRALFPAQPTISEGYEVAVRYIPVFAAREIGGDFYDVFTAQDDLAGILIGDVSGKGLEAASLAATTRSTIHAFVHEAQSPSEAMTRANTVIYPQQPSVDSFVTAALFMLTLSTGHLSYSTAGHPPAAILRADGTIQFLAYGSLPLGLMEIADYEEHSETINPGDKLLLYTDGISEAHDHSGLFENEGIERAVGGHSEWSVDEVADNLIAAATDWAKGKLRDDAAVVVIERRADIPADPADCSCSECHPQ